MPLASRTTRRFEKSVKLMQRRGKDMSKLRHIMEKLIDEEPLEPRHRDHVLTGNYVGRRGCQVEPDWLLIYQVGSDWILFESFTTSPHRTNDIRDNTTTPKPACTRTTSGTTTVR